MDQGAMPGQIRAILSALSYLCLGGLTALALPSLQAKQPQPTAASIPTGSPAPSTWLPAFATKAAEDPNGLIGNVLTLMGGLGVLGFWGASLQAYRRQKHWERVNFALERVNDFKNNSTSMLARELIDASVWITTIDENDPSKYIICDSHVIKALEPYRNHSQGFTAGEMAVRISFDAFCMDLEHFCHLIDAGLAKRRDLDPYLHYWLDALGGTRKGSKQSWKAAATELKDDEWRLAFFGFVDSFGYVGCRRLLEKYGYTPPPLKITARGPNQSNCCLTEAQAYRQTWNQYRLINDAGFGEYLQGDCSWDRPHVV